ncbi:multicopper oxidase domain-containing protein [Arthrobacter rhombi]|uniref:Copper-containing nitrite reductase n=1 Tax=Arthrobacter rhombi TaxID=71253 RepID=A0A1R4GTR6_9MICC|nr:multicopper oxidase domain-containing protein [Arthrobacter rhombi]SJM71481.1 Multicopper oxidase [Arthrobacter rhombi]
MKIPTVPGASPPGSRPTPGPDPARFSRAQWHLRANAPMLFWLIALAVVVAAHRFLPVATWLMVHLLLLGAIGNAIMVWSSHFAQALLRGPDHGRVYLTWRLVGLNAGVIATVVGMVTNLWVLVLIGSILVGAAFALHGISFAVRASKALPSRFGATVNYYIAASWLLPVGAALGALLAAGYGGEIRQRLLVAHAVINVLGFVGLTVLGTLATLLPTMLRTRVAEGAESAVRHGWLPLLGGVAVAGAGSGLGWMWLVAAGLVIYIGGIIHSALPVIRAILGKPPTDFAPLSAGASLLWLTGSVAVLAVMAGRGPSWETLYEQVQSVVPALAAGFASQVLLGALSYLLPVVLGGGPAVFKVRAAVFNSAAGARLVLLNLGLGVALLPVPSWVKVTTSTLVLVALVWFLILVLKGLRAGKASTVAPQEVAGSEQPGKRLMMSAVAGVTGVVLAVALGIVADPAAAGVGASATTEGESGAGSAQQGPAATGDTTHVQMSMEDMRFTPDTVHVPVGDRLVIDVVNQDDRVHDLLTANGAASGRVAPGAHRKVDAGVITADTEGWCSLAGHRQMGMVFTIIADGAQDSAAADSEPLKRMDSKDHGGHGGSAEDASGTAGNPAAGFDPMRAPGQGFVARDARLPAASRAPTHHYTLTAQDTERDVGADYAQTLWTYNGTAPGPTLRGTVGDKFRITLRNEGTTGHSIDFHAGALAPDRPMRTIEPGEELTYTFTATRAGAWLYHCSTMPMSLHIANGMFGAVIIDPPDLAPVDHEFIMVQNELYLGKPGGTAEQTKIDAETPDAVVFNGYASQYAFDPLHVKVGERARFWVVAAGPNRGSAFHVIGGQFDTTYREGRYLLDGSDPHAGSQTLDIGVAQGGFAELEFTEAGNYPFVSHSMVDAERGARGIIKVTR